MDYPGASPEIVESEVTKKIEEAVNTIAGINTPCTRAYEGSRSSSSSSTSTSTAARPPRTCARRSPLIRPLLRDEVKEPRVLRFDPASRPDLLAGGHRPTASAKARKELTTWADQVLQEAAGERARRRLGERWWAA
jgi:HAE1 family hydrophobic/amphiphilic exporter-1